MTVISATWRTIAEGPSLQRSSSNVASIDGKVYIFGGELKPREPRDNDIYTVPVKDASKLTSDDVSVIRGEEEASPSPRVGAASTTLSGKMYVFSGRGGTAMAPIEEQGRLWIFSTEGQRWSSSVPSTSTAAYPAGRSYHAMTSNGIDTIYVHAGCPEEGRLNDLWAFHTPTQTWTELKPAPGPPRGGTSLVFCSGKLYRMNGFDGKIELGGAIDIYDLQSNDWTMLAFPADGRDGPGARSVSALLPVSVKGDLHLVTLFGESDPSSLGHQGAGKMLSDIWAFDLRKQTWKEVKARVEGGGHRPAARGWFAADAIDDKSGVVVAGGLAEDNSRLGDVWVLEL